MGYALAGIGGLVLLAGIGWWMLAEAKQLIGELVAENTALREGAEAHDEADKILAGSVASGGRLRAHLLARALRGLPGSDQSIGAAASAKPESTGG
jgi:hypothetical protein